jgi:hypothetical protein
MIRMEINGIELETVPGVENVLWAVGKPYYFFLRSIAPVKLAGPFQSCTEAVFEHSAWRDVVRRARQ